MSATVRSLFVCKYDNADVKENVSNYFYFQNNMVTCTLNDIHLIQNTLKQQQFHFIGIRGEFCACESDR